MKFQITNKFLKKLKKGQKISGWWFKIWTAKPIWKRIKKIYKITYKTNLATTPFEKLVVYPEDFKKFSNENIERAFNLFVKDGGLKSWNKQIQQNADVYLLILNIENLLQDRFSTTQKPKINRIIQEIDLDSVNVEPITQSPDTNIKVDSTALTNPEQEPYEDDAEEFEEDYANDDYSTPF